MGIGGFNDDSLFARVDGVVEKVGHGFLVSSGYAMDVHQTTLDWLENVTL